MACALAAAALAPSGVARAYPTPVDFDGSVLRWDITRDAPVVRYEIIAERDADRAVYADTVREAAQMWTDIPNSYFTYAEAAEGETVQVTIHLDSAIDGGSYSAGYTIFDAYEEGLPSKPKHASIYVAITDDQSPYSIAKTMLHELGHGLGLGHTLIPEAIMSYSLDRNTYALDLDDEAAAARLYPIDGSKPHLPPGCAVGAATAGQSPLAMLVLVAPLLALAVSVRDRRRR